MSEDGHEYTINLSQMFENETKYPNHKQVLGPVS